MTPTAGLAVLTIVGTLAYLGLAVLGAGGLAAFFSHPARIALTVVLFALSGATRTAHAGCVGAVHCGRMVGCDNRL